MIFQTNVLLINENVGYSLTIGNIRISCTLSLMLQLLFMNFEAFCCLENLLLMYICCSNVRNVFQTATGRRFNFYCEFHHTIYIEPLFNKGFLHPEKFHAVILLRRRAFWGPFISPRINYCSIISYPILYHSRFIEASFMCKKSIWSGDSKVESYSAAYSIYEIYNALVHSSRCI